MRHRTLIVAVALAFAAGFATCYVWNKSGPEPLAPNFETTIGFIGCSNTAQAVIGYERVGGNKVWEIPNGREHDFDGGAVRDWVESDTSFWQTFDNYHAANPNTRAVWWQMCVRNEDEPTLEDALEVVSGIKDRIPNVTIYVSSLPSYRGGVCRITGTAGIVRGRELALQLTEFSEKGDVIPGPALRPHTLEELVDDGCHMNDAGMRSVGEQLRAFFDAL